MIHRNSHLFLFLLLQFSFLLSLSLSQDDLLTGGRRFLLSFKETPRGANTSFDCSPSGPCLPCLYSEKGDEKYRCSETGYRIPFKCVEIKGGVKEDSGGKTKPQRNRSAMETPSGETTTNVTALLEGARRSLLDDSATTRLESSGGQAYITYRSCIPAANEVKWSVIGFEGIVFFLFLISGSAVYYRKKRAVNTMPGVGGGRIQMSSKF